MEGQTVGENMRVCSKCRTIKDTVEFYKSGMPSKKTGERYYSSLCKGCHKGIVRVAYHKRKAEKKIAANTGQQLVLRSSVALPPPPLLDTDLPVLEFPRDAYSSDPSLSE